jgi:uncharacterized protein YecE (DUF72 family)
MERFFIGTAGWSIPRTAADAFPSEGTALERYAARFRGAEINSSFHRPHRISTWERWREATPADFRFSVKLPKTITHQHKLVGYPELLAPFLSEVRGLGDKLAVLLVQLPPKLEFDAETVRAFFAMLSGRTAAAIACEPRNRSWFEHSADDLLASLGVARVAADPAICPAAAQPGGSAKLRYWRLHGSPVIYRSSYADRIAGYADSIRAQHNEGQATWCIFDNTASSAAVSDALRLTEALGVE